MKGQIVAVHRGRYEIETETGHTFGVLKASEYYKEDSSQAFPVTGDYVELLPNPQGDCLITLTHSRKSVFSRKDPDAGVGEQVLAANFDYIFIMMSLNGDYNLKRLDRYLVSVGAGGGQAVIILTKADLCPDTDEIAGQIRAYAPGIPVHAVSAVNGLGMDALSEYMQPDNTLIFLGSSGVGKSTFTNALLGQNRMDTGAIREDDAKGRHTTTRRQLFKLDSGLKIIDTPGMRELELWDGINGLDQGFSEIEELAHQCLFKDCSHKNEPGCAVRKAMEYGILDEMKYLSYKKLEKEAKFLQEKEKKNLIKTGKSRRKKPVRESVRDIEREWE